MTNGDKIRALPDEDLADILHEYCVGLFDCEGCVLEKYCGEYRGPVNWSDWLKSEAEE